MKVSDYLLRTWVCVAWIQNKIVASERLIPSAQYFDHSNWNVESWHIDKLAPKKDFNFKRNEIIKKIISVILSWLFYKWISRYFDTTIIGVAQKQTLDFGVPILDFLGPELSFTRLEYQIFLFCLLFLSMEKICWNKNLRCFCFSPDQHFAYYWLCSIWELWRVFW